jgi:hypothetical protein
MIVALRRNYRSLPQIPKTENESRLGSQRPLQKIKKTLEALTTKMDAFKMR